MLKVSRQPFPKMSVFLLLPIKKEPMSNIQSKLTSTYFHSTNSINEGLGALVDYCHQANVSAGWWTNPGTKEPISRNTGELLMLCVSELSEAMEGDRKDLMDDKLPHRKMLEVELADAIIRICDLAGAHRLDLGGALVEKLAYNVTRLDHTHAARMAEGGKKY